MPRTISLSICATAIVFACDDPLPRVAAVPDASATVPEPPAPREGCARVGRLDGVEAEPSCVVKRASEDAMRAALKQLTVTIAAEPPEVVAGGTALLSITIRNTSSSEVTLLFEARPRPPGPRTDWARVSGIPEPHPTVSEIPRLLFPMTTTDSHNHDVDQLPTVQHATLSPSPPTILAVNLRAGGKLTHAISWWALRIPAPAPIVTDDAGHRYVPKTTAVHLRPGDYTVTVELPFYGLSREERKVMARVKVTRAPLLDGGFRPLY